MGYWGWRPYVSVAERRKKAEKAAAKAKRGGAALTPIAPYRGAIAKTFWGKAWCDNLERYSDYANRLPRGRTYVRNGSVIDLKISAGGVQALVIGSSLYKVTVSVVAVPEKQWQAIRVDCSNSIDSLVELLQGKLSSAVMERICKAESGLFPAPAGMQFSCSCPDWADMCKHVAAVLYGVGARLDHEPELIFSLRRVDARELVAEGAVSLTKAKAAPAAGKLLDDSLLAEVFGIEMTEPTMATPPAKPKAKTGSKKAKATARIPQAKPKAKPFISVAKNPATRNGSLPKKKALPPVPRTKPVKALKTASNKKAARKVRK